MQPHRKIMLIETAKAGVFAAKVVDDTYLEQALSAGTITHDEYDAASRWLMDWIASGFGGRRCSWSDASHRADSHHPFERMNTEEEKHWRDYLDARNAIRNVCAAAEAGRVVIWNEPIDNISALRIGLNALSEHYRLR